MRDKQYFTVDDLDAAHRSGVAFGLTNSSKGKGNTGSRVERALELIRSRQGGTKVEESKTKDATKLLFELGLSAAAITAATGGSGSKRGPTADDTSSSSNPSSASSKGKAGTDLPFGLTLGKDGNAAPAIEGKVASMLGMVGKVATKVNPAIGIGITLLTSLLSEDLTGKAKDFNKAEEAKFQTMLDNTDKDYSKITGLLGITDSDYSNISSNSYSPAEDSSAAYSSNSSNSSNSDDGETPNYSNGSTDN